MSDIKTPIQEKIEEKENNNSSLPKANWRRFAYLSLFSFIFILIISILGSNFIYMTSLSAIALENTFLPVKADFYTEKGEKYNQSGGYDKEYYTYDDNCSGKSKSGDFSKMSFLPSKGFPYSMYATPNSNAGIIQKIKNWFSATCLESFINSRSVLRGWLGFFSQGSFLGNDTIQMLFIAPLNLLLGSTIAFIVGLITTIMALYKTSGFIAFILGFIFLYNFAFISTISVIQSVLFALTFLFVPLIVDFKKVMSIFHCNITTITTLFGLLTCINALFTFDLTTSAVLIVTYVLITVISLFI